MARGCAGIVVVGGLGQVIKRGRRSEERMIDFTLYTSSMQFALMIDWIFQDGRGERKVQIHSSVICEINIPGKVQRDVVREMKVAEEDTRYVLETFGVFWLLS